MARHHNRRRVCKSIFRFILGHIDIITAAYKRNSCNAINFGIIQYFIHMSNQGWVSVVFFLRLLIFFTHH